MDILRALRLLALSGAAICALAQTRPLALRAARLFDGVHEAEVRDAVVLVEQGRIRAVGSKLPIPAGTEVLDLGDVTLVPGLIDCHTHLLLDLDPDMETTLRNMERTLRTLTVADRVRLGAANARAMLRAGFTTVRDLGNAGHGGDVALRKAIAKGEVEGPRMLVSTRALSPVGGQFLGEAAQDASLVALEYVEVRDAASGRRAARRALSEGADCLKVIVDSGRNRMDPGALKSVVAVAHGAHRKVAAHCVAPDAVDEAIAAGVDSVEHGYQATEPQLQAMARKGIFLVPTDGTFESAQDLWATPEARAREATSDRAWVEACAARLRLAARAGVPLAMGSDLYYRFPGRDRGQAAKDTLRAYARAGLSPFDILRAATGRAADLLGRPDRGRIAPGCLADLIAVAGDPMQDPASLEQARFVMKGGIEIRSIRP